MAKEKRKSNAAEELSQLQSSDSSSSDCPNSCSSVSEKCGSASSMSTDCR